MTPQTDVSLARWCTLEIGGSARWFVRAQNETEIRSALSWARDRRAVLHVLGGGSNVVFSDEGFNGLVVQVDVRGVEREVSAGQRLWAVGAGESWDDFVDLSVDENAAGIECLSGIPGLVGGTPVQNVGAYGQDVSGVIRCVHAIDRVTGRAVVLDTGSCGFGYRTSRFKREGSFIVSRVVFALRPDGDPTVTYADVVRHFEAIGRPKPTLHEVREAILSIRRQKGMVVEPSNPANRSVGSFFVNPVITSDHFARIRERFSQDIRIPHYPAVTGFVKLPAAWLIEQAGFRKGLRREKVGISPFQAQAIVNHGGASANDVVALATDIKRTVWNMFSIALLPEPVFIGFSPTPELRWLTGVSSPDPAMRANRG